MLLLRAAFVLLSLAGLALCAEDYYKVRMDEHMPQQIPALHLDPTPQDVATLPPHLYGPSNPTQDDGMLTHTPRRSSA